VKIRIGPSRTGRFCSFVDKDFMAIDPARGRLYVAYTDFLIRLPFPSQVELAACDSATPPAAAGRRHPGRAGLQARHGPGPGEREVLPGKPYFVVAKPDPEAVSARAPTRPPGGVHRLRVQLVHDLFAPCNGAATPTADVMTGTPRSCLPLKAFAACSGPRARTSEPVTSLSATPVPGYNRFPASDFPGWRSATATAR
jgi:hypothetical protein